MPGMRIGLDRVVPAIDCGQRPAQRLRLRAHGREVVDVVRRRLVRESQQVVAPRLPPRRALRLRFLVQVAPARPEHSAVLDAHRLGLDQQVVQLRHEARADLLVDDEREVEIVRRLRDQVHAQRTELGEHRRQLVQHRAHAAADQRDRRARRDHLDAADLREVLAQRRQHVGIDEILARIQRDGDVGFRRADEIDRQPVALELLEHVGEEADLLPHADRLHRDQRDAAARGDRLDARRGIARARADLRAGEVGIVRVPDRERHARPRARG